MYNNYNTVGSSSNLLGSATVGNAVWAIVAFILALVGAFLVYFLFVKPEKKFDNGFLNWLRNFLDFQNMLIEVILKISYIFTALLITLESFGIIGTSFVSFLVVLIGGNILARVIYETSMILIGVWKNTRDINKKLK